MSASGLVPAGRGEPEAVKERLATVKPGASPGHIVGLCGQACHTGVSPDAALRALAKSAALNDADQAYQVLLELHQGLAEAGADEDTRNSWQFRFSELLAAGEFGPELGHQLRVLVSERTRRDIWHELRFLEIFAAAGREHEYEWTADERDELMAIAAEIESMLKRSRKFPLAKKLGAVLAGQTDVAKTVDLATARSAGQRVVRY